MLKRFDKIFGIQATQDDERQKFVNRVNQTIFENVGELIDYSVSYEPVFRGICYQLGVNADDRIEKETANNFVLNTTVPSLRSLTNDEFFPTLKVLVLLHSLGKEVVDRVEISKLIKAALSQATVDLGVRWKGGMFYPSGAKALDEKLVEDPFDWLEDYPDEKKNFLKAVTSYTENELGDVIINSYLVIEGLTRKILNNTKTLDNNREELLKKVSLSQEWKSLLSAYTRIAHEKRHASEKRHAIKRPEAEAFLYLTGLLVRLLIESKQP